MTYTIQEFKIWKGVDPVNPTWQSVNITPGTREGAEEVLELLTKNSPDRQFRIHTNVSQMALDRLRHTLDGARERVRASEGYAGYVAREIEELKREAYRQGVELR